MGISFSLISHLGHKTEECAPDIHQASLRVILQSLTFRFCGVEQPQGFFSWTLSKSLTYCNVLQTI